MQSLYLNLKCKNIHLQMVSNNYSHILKYMQSFMFVLSLKKNTWTGIKCVEFWFFGIAYKLIYDDDLNDL